VALLEARGTDWFRERYPEVFASKHWARGEEVVAEFGWPGVAGLSAMPFPLHPLVVLGVLAGMKKRALLSALFLGRLTKYLAFGWVATTSPGALRRLRGGDEKRK
jgi:membrane protein YqaA with SNARE-associated domain